MKRMHVHVSVANIDNAVGFYSALFDTKPTVVKDDYAKWMLDDPDMNFAISTRGRDRLDHLGIQVESQTELHEVYARLKTAGGTVIEQGETACCYAKSEKSWIDDPAGIWRKRSTRLARISAMATAAAKTKRVSHTPKPAACQRQSRSPKRRAAVPRPIHDRKPSDVRFVPIADICAVCTHRQRRGRVKFYLC